MTRIVAAEHSEHVTNIVADVLEAAKNVDWNGNRIAWVKNNLAIFAFRAQIKCPGSGMNDENFSRFMTML